MPYIITTTNPVRLAAAEAAFDEAGGRGVELAEELDTLRSGKPVAVATLDEAREAVSRALWENGAEPDSYRLVEQFDKFDANGGSVGPLPDGTVIDVRRVSWTTLAYRAFDRFPPSTDPSAILAAFNDKHGE